jgi:hypothetical protein
LAGLRSGGVLAGAALVARARDGALVARLGLADHFEGAGAVGQAADEAAFFQRGDQAVDA